MNLKDRRRRALTGLAAGLLALLSAAALAETPQSTPPAAHAEKLAEAQDLFDERKYNEAVKAFKEADKLANGTCVECRLGLARTFNELGAYKEVLKNADAVLSMTGEKNHLIRAHNERGVALVELAGGDPKKLEAAERAFRQAFDLSEGKVNAVRFSLGVTLLRLSRDEEGIALLKEYLEREPNGSNAETAKALLANPVRARKRLIPEFELATLDGDYLTSDDLKGKVLLLDFWATWCAPCRMAVPSLRLLSRRMKGEPFVLLSVSTDSDEAALRQFLTENGMTWPQVWDKQHEFTRKCGIEGFSTYVVVSHEGEITHVASGWGPGIEQDLLSKVSAAVRAAKKSAKQADKVQ